MVLSLGRAITRYPTSFGCWNCLLLEVVAGTVEIAVLGPDPDLDKIHKELLAQFIPHRAVMMSSIENEEFALLAEKPITSQPTIYICKNFQCLAPVYSIEAVLPLINSV
jgi:uncharacterized protein